MELSRERAQLCVLCVFDDMRARHQLAVQICEGKAWGEIMMGLVIKIKKRNLAGFGGELKAPLSPNAEGFFKAATFAAARSVFNSTFARISSWAFFRIYKLCN